MATILLIEDNPANRKLAVLLLRKAGHVVLESVDAKSGLACAREDRPELILMDIQLPDLDGLSATRLLKADPHTASIPIIALTAFAMRGDEARMRAAGCDAYIAKPIVYQEFLATVAAVLARSGSI